MPIAICEKRANKTAQMLTRTLSTLSSCQVLWWDSDRVSGDRAFVEIEPDIIIYDNSLDLAPLQRHAYSPEKGLRRVLIYCGDYMGEDPVILTRDSKGEIHAFFLFSCGSVRKAASYTPHACTPLPLLLLWRLPETHHG